jgi:uncharacterized protein with HEPN domain
MKKALRVPDYLEHIREAIERIFRYVEDLDETAFAGSQLVQDAVIRNIEIIGEASRNIEQVDPGFIAKHPEIEFADSRAMRNAVVHGYFEVDLEVVWQTVKQDLDLMRSQVVEALREYTGRENQ